MDEEIEYFVTYLEDVKKASHNTVMSYRSDLAKMRLYVEGQGVYSVSAITATVLNSYVLYLEKNGMAASTISRYIASMKAFWPEGSKGGKADAWNPDDSGDGASSSSAFCGES